MESNGFHPRLSFFLFRGRQCTSRGERGHFRFLAYPPSQLRLPLSPKKPQAQSRFRPGRNKIRRTQWQPRRCPASKRHVAGIPVVPDIPTVKNVGDSVICTLRRGPRLEDCDRIAVSVRLALAKKRHIAMTERLRNSTNRCSTH
jgi:hypothetical protein